VLLLVHLDLDPDLLQLLDLDLDLKNILSVFQTCALWFLDPDQIPVDPMQIVLVSIQSAKITRVLLLQEKTMMNVM